MFRSNKTPDSGQKLYKYYMLKVLTKKSEQTNWDECKKWLKENVVNRKQAIKLISSCHKKNETVWVVSDYLEEIKLIHCVALHFIDSYNTLVSIKQMYKPRVTIKEFFPDGCYYFWV